LHGKKTPNIFHSLKKPAIPEVTDGTGKWQKGMEKGLRPRKEEKSGRADRPSQEGGERVHLIQ